MVAVSAPAGESQPSHAHPAHPRPPGISSRAASGEADQRRPQLGVEGEIRAAACRQSPSTKSAAEDSAVTSPNRTGITSLDLLDLRRRPTLTQREPAHLGAPVGPSRLLPAATGAPTSSACVANSEQKWNACNRTGYGPTEVAIAAPREPAAPVTHPPPGLTAGAQPLVEYHGGGRSLRSRTHHSLNES